ncbi:hypothetical protein EE612_053291, partial [Oryza sativa]
EVGSVRRRVVEENKKLWVVAGPSICARFSSFGVTVISQAFIGHIGATELAAYALVSTVLMRFSNGILLGMAKRLETLVWTIIWRQAISHVGHLSTTLMASSLRCAVILLRVYIFTTPLPDCSRSRSRDLCRRWHHLSMVHPQ